MIALLGRQLRKDLIPQILITTLVILLASISLMPIASAEPDPSPKGMLFSSDPAGNKKEVFLPSEDVYVYGVGLVKNTQYKITVIDDTTMMSGDIIPSPASGTTITDVTTDGNGYFGPIVIWSNPLTPGYYDIIADCQTEGNIGYFDRETDAEDTIEASGKYGFFVIPEYTAGTILALAVCFASFGVYKSTKHIIHKKL